MEFTILVKCSDRLCRKDVVKDINAGIQCICGGGNPHDWYIKELSKTKVQLQVTKRTTLKNSTKP